MFVTVFVFFAGGPLTCAAQSALYFSHADSAPPWLLSAQSAPQSAPQHVSSSACSLEVGYQAIATAGDTSLCGAITIRNNLQVCMSHYGGGDN